MPDGIHERGKILRPTLVFVGTFLLSLWVFRPWQYYFHGDSWDCLFDLLVGWKTIFLPHNEHFMPLFKAFYFLEYKLFGAHHLPYMVVGLALHAGIAVFVYLLGRRLGLGPRSSLAATLIFAFSSIHWEVTGWSFEQTLQLSALFTLASIYIFIQNPHGGKQLAWLIILSVTAYWFGPLAAVLPASLSVYYLLWTIDRSESIPKERILTTLLAVWLPTVIYLISLRALKTFTSVLAVHHNHPRFQDIPAMMDFTLYGAAYGLVLPSLTFIHPQSVVSAALVLPLVVLVLAVCYRQLSAGAERVHFWFLISLLLAPLFAASLFRLQMFGVQAGIASRYQYLPMVPFALLVALCWKTFVRTLTSHAARICFNALGTILLAYYLLFHISVVRHAETNPAIDRGRQAKAFLVAARRATYPQTVSADVSILGPELQVPGFLSPGRLPLWKAFQVLEGDRQKVVLVGDYLRDKDASFDANLVRDGGFETREVENQWKTYGSAKFERSGRAALKGSFGVETSLGQDAAFSQDVIKNCPTPLPRTIFTFSIQAKTHRQGTLRARIIFKDTNNGILGGVESLPHPGDDQWHQLIISGLSPEGTCTVGVDVVNAGPAQLASMLDEAILVAHPGTVDRNRKIAFQSLAAILSRGAAAKVKK